MVYRGFGVLEGLAIWNHEFLFRYSKKSAGPGPFCFIRIKQDPLSNRY